MRAVITGVAGFIGSHLAEAMTAGGWSVTGVDSFTPYYPTADKEANLAGLRSDPDFDLVRADLVSMDLHKVLAGSQAVIHLAAQPGVRQSFGDGFDQYVHDNVLATQRVFETALETGCRRVVYASSSSVYGDATEFPTHEGLPTRPRSPYGVTKRTCESLAGVYRDLGLETVGLRYFTVYGPRQRPDMAIRRLCETAHGGAGYQMFGNGTASRDFTYVTDAVDATIRAATVATCPNPVLNIGGGEEATMSRVISMLEAFSGHWLPVEVSDTQTGDVIRTAADTSLARRQLGWKPTVGLAEGLLAELDWVGNRLGNAETVGALAHSHGNVS
jgi:UDP-glucuronate 4-epimerase